MPSNYNYTYGIEDIEEVARIAANQGRKMGEKILRMVE